MQTDFDELYKTQVLKCVTLIDFPFLVNIVHCWALKAIVFYFIEQILDSL